MVAASENIKHEKLFTRRMAIVLPIESTALHPKIGIRHLTEWYNIIIAECMWETVLRT